MAKNEFCKKKRHVFRLIWCNQSSFFGPFIFILCESISIFLSSSLFFLLFLLYWRFCYPLYRLYFAWNCGWLTFWERDKFNFQNGVVCTKQRNWQWIFPQNVTFFNFGSVTLSGFGQNIQNEVSLKRSIFVDVVAYQFVNFNWKLNGGFREKCVHRSIWGRVRPYQSEKG